MEGYIKIKLTDKMSCDDSMDKYGVGECDPQDLSIGISGIILTIYKKSNEINEVYKYI